MLTRPEELAEHIKTIVIEADAPTFHFGSVLLYDDDKVPVYPALIIANPNASTTIHGTNQLRTTFTTIMYVLHADAGLDRKVRNEEDLRLATALIRLLEAPYDDGMGNVGAALTLRDQVRAGIVATEMGAALPVASKKSALVVSTRLTHTCFVQSLFNRQSSPAFQ